MVKQWIWALVDSISAVNVHIAISSRSHDTSCIFGYHPTIATAWHTRIDSISSIWLLEADLFVSMICYNTICIGLLPTDHRICMPILIDTLICAQHVRPENCREKIITHCNETKKIFFISSTVAFCQLWFILTQFSNESPNAEKAPPSVDNHDIKFSISIISHVNTNARRHLKLFRVHSINFRVWLQFEKQKGVASNILPSVID